MFAGEEIRNADGEADDVAAFGLEALGLFGDRHDGAGLARPMRAANWGIAEPRDGRVARQAVGKARDFSTRPE